MARGLERSDILDPVQLHRGVLALDLSSTVGWARADRASVLCWPVDKPGAAVRAAGQTAFVQPCARPRGVGFGSLRLGTGSHGVRGELLRQHLDAELEAGRQGYVLLEEAIPAHRSRNRVANELALGFRMVARAVAARHGAAVREYNVVSVKAWMTGQVHATKPAMIAAAAATGWHVATDHEADALAILDLACARSAGAARMLGRAA